MTIAQLLALSFLAFVPTARPAPVPQAEVAPELSSPKARKALHLVTNDLARLGRGDLVLELQQILRDLGATEREAKSWERKAARFLERAKGEPKARAVESAAKRLQGGIDGLADSLDPPGGESSTRLATLILRLDAENARAHAALGHEQWKGTFALPEVIAFERRAEAAEAAAAAAAALDVEVTVTRPSSSPLLRKLYGEDSHSVSSHGITLHGGIEVRRLERALRQGVRGIAFSHWVMTGDVAVPKLEKTYNLTFVDNNVDYETAADMAVASSWFSQADRDRMKAFNMESFILKSGERCSRWRPEGRISSLVHWAVRGVVPDSVQPALRAGHTNWVSLRFFGTGKPAAMIREERAGAQGTTAEAQARTDALWRAASSGVFGARCWVRGQLRKGKSMSFSRATLDQEGKVAGEPLLIATLATEYLQITGDFAAAASSKRKEDATVVEAMEAALARSIPEFDALWTEWLMAEVEAPGQSGMLQRLTSANPSLPGAADSASDDVHAAVAHLSALRKQAFTPLDVFTESIEPFPELCEQCALHAAYLGQHPEQKTAWPDAHEQYPDQSGFSAKGAWAGTHSVIAFTGDATSAIDQWMGTFFHRLPLLNPGLCGTGLAIDQDVVLLDVGSLANQYRGEALVAWPHDGMTDVPLRFVPELPNPVPGEEQAGFGYPFTVQAYWGAELAERSLELSMFLGESDDAVECHVITPDAPLFDRLAPEGAYCLIPKQHLGAGTPYRVLGRCVETGEVAVWRFRTGDS